MRLRVCGRLLAAAAASIFVEAAEAEPLTVVEVSLTDVTCLFSRPCSVVLSDRQSAIPLPYLETKGTAWLHSRTFPAQAGTQAAGLYGYMYRISLAEARGGGGCLVGFFVNFGPISKLPYKSGAPPADVFVILESNQPAMTGLASAEQDGPVVTFRLKSRVCSAPATGSDDPAEPVEPVETGEPAEPDEPTATATFFIAMASSLRPGNGEASIFAYGNPPLYSVPIRVPGGAPDAPTGLTILP